MSSAAPASYFHGEADKAFNVASMRKYVQQKQEMDKRLVALLGPLLGDRPATVFDACCGVGHVAGLVREAFPRATYCGVDETPYLIEEARQLFASDAQVRFEVGDVCAFAPTHEKQFDLTICWKTVSWLPSYEPLMQALLRATRSHIVLSSLFYEGDIDYEIKVREYQKEAGAAGWNAYYNIYSLPRFTRWLTSQGVRSVKAEDFVMPIDLPRPSPHQMGTYTVPLADGTRLQMSGALALPWKIVTIQL